ncbi:hypothetical protein KUTeg_006472 [Tegillarca granosa]|uniref:Uncharacterized protein n=1 Tax=Tegillarca granosa TaxID=220873 RepID=A0ABQ9FGL5_TEGGR|nr:hypothetical protein KUTeg_006472 [Tegillarca granosa]
MNNTESYEISTETSTPNDGYSSLRIPCSGLVNNEYEEISFVSQSYANLEFTQELDVDTNNKPSPVYTNMTLSNKAFGVLKEHDKQQKEERKKTEMEEPEPVYE